MDTLIHRFAGQRLGLLVNDSDCSSQTLAVGYCQIETAIHRRPQSGVCLDIVTPWGQASVRFTNIIVAFDDEVKYLLVCQHCVVYLGS